ncbi:putative drug exporter of the RND superfamily [Leifsonia sp. 98AMF]|uniref:MMPL family transporter n=1 Tax=unclassified Leifsonia TaxID=2663824 RepID=UPI00087BDAF7|nr:MULTISPECIES: MMPL family transporter [unclassified Leifsonia]SDH16468.1 putative drug exporter of the RND superfamily [Leifsonia sp. 197AMF]SDJ21825.1 putative drug exporter of the RND superfamily [Leifsonia sp. 466MF]SDJ42924.1 putative drug exporter of the RND superfamily [Leifsonia sp. 157MF]SDN43499.1 putative drug exporter of the RND superfamily [Leifsonia sp. 509MF]SEN67679.1 putative drug exporter of the RND superfamily [Leifsonia sp. 467MF]
MSKEAPERTAPARVPARWLRIVVPTVLVLIWLVLAGIGGPTFGKLSGVSSNDQAAFLPASAESTEVQDWQKRFTDSGSIPAIVVVEADESIPKSELGTTYADLGTKLGGVDGVEPAPEGQTTSVAGPIPSEDGRAVEYIVPISDSDELKTVVADLRTVADDAVPEGAQAWVTGPAGLTADLVNAFGGIDGILLLVAVAAVFVILLLVYRALLLPFLVLLTSVFALCAAILIVYLFALWGWIKLSGQSQGILSILVIGAATDYSLLLVSRYREALEVEESRWVAILRAWKASFEPIVASGATVILALLCLLFSDLNSNKSLGPIAAIGIVFSLFSALTFLPALLAVFGRASFWPFRPVVGGHEHKHADGTTLTGLEGVRGVWRRVGGLIARRPRVTWIVSFVLLVACALGLTQLKANGVQQTDVILSQSDAVDGQAVVAKHFDAGSGSPVLIVAPESEAEAVLTATEKTDGIASAAFYTGGGRPQPGAPADPVVKGGHVLIQATLASEPDSAQAEKVVKGLRESLSTDGSVLVGGVTAIALDTNETAQSDLIRIIPIVLAVILLILMLLLRSIVAPVILIGSVVLSYAAALGVSALVFNHVFGFPGADAAVPLFGFVFLVALGVDYNIFLMTRVREESLRIGTRPGILRGLGLTGSVITSAGIVLAATFAALAVIPILFLVQIAFIVAFGVLLDTVVVRSLLVPAVSYDIGRAIWWPSKLSRSKMHSERAEVSS